MEAENLVHKAVVVVFQELVTDLRVRMQVGLVVKRLATPHNIRSVQQSGGPSKDGWPSLQKPHAARLPSWHDSAGVWQTIHDDLFLTQNIGLDNYHAGVFLRQTDHLFEAFWKQPVVREHHLAVLACRRDLLTRDVVVIDYAGEILVVLDSDSGILDRILPRNFKRPVSAAIVDDCVIPVRIRLGEHALDTLAEITFAVKDGRHDTDERLFHGVHLSHNGQRATSDLTGC